MSRCVCVWVCVLSFFFFTFVESIWGICLTKLNFCWLFLPTHGVQKKHITLLFGFFMFTVCYEKKYRSFVYLFLVLLGFFGFVRILLLLLPPPSPSLSLRFFASHFLLSLFHFIGFSTSISILKTTTVTISVRCLPWNVIKGTTLFTPIIILY